MNTTTLHNIHDAQSPIVFLHYSMMLSTELRIDHTINLNILILTVS